MHNENFHQENLKAIILEYQLPNFKKFKKKKKKLILKRNEIMQYFLTNYDRFSVNNLNWRI